MQIISNVCDMKHHDNHVEADPYTVAVNGMTVQVDLCGDCGGRVLNLFSELQDVGRPEGKQLAGAHDCPDCSRSFTSTQGLSMHRRKAHGVPGPHSRVKADAVR